MAQEFSAFAPRSISRDELPVRLRQLQRPVHQAWLSGELPARKAIAVIGTRAPSEPAQNFAEQLAQAIAERGMLVLSGGALGIDAAAHRGALRAKGQTIVVAPAGLLACYPSAHRELFAAILAAGGGYLSLVAPRVEARRHHFFRRNEVLVALADAVVIVEAPLRSGARNATAAARALGRPVFVVPHAPWSERGAGCALELELGARAISSAAGLLRALDERVAAPATRPEVPASREQLELLARLGRPGNSELILEALGQGAKLIDDVCRTTGLPTPAVQASVLALELAGRIARGESGELVLVAP